MLLTALLLTHILRLHLSVFSVLMKKGLEPSMYILFILPCLLKRSHTTDSASITLIQNGAKRSKYSFFFFNSSSFFVVVVDILLLLLLLLDFPFVLNLSLSKSWLNTHHLTNWWLWFLYPGVFECFYQILKYIIIFPFDRRWSFLQDISFLFQ